MPIISISLNESLKRFLDKLVNKNQYQNKSKLIRDALLRLMSTMDSSSIESSYDIIPITKKILGNLIIIIPAEAYIQKKLNRIENDYSNNVVSKTQHFHAPNLIIFMVFEGKVDEFQKFVVEINSIKEIVNFRYLIVN